MKRFDAPNYLLISGHMTAPIRLEILREAARKSAKTWRDERRYGYHNWAAAHGAMSQGFNTENPGTQWEKKSPIWYTHTGEKFRNELDAHEVPDVPMNHTGWYSDVDGNEMIIGIVASLPHGRFIAGYRMAMNGERVYFGDIYTDAGEAASAADSAAETLAYDEREYNIRWNEAHALADECTDLEKQIALEFTARHTLPYAKDDCLISLDSLRTKRAELKNDYSDVEI